MKPFMMSRELPLIVSFSLVFSLDLDSLPQLSFFYRNFVLGESLVIQSIVYLFFLTRYAQCNYTKP